MSQQAITNISLGPESGVLTYSWDSAFFLNNGEVLAYVEIGGTTGAEATSWGAVKALFR